VKAFVLLRGESGMLYLYNRETWEYMLVNKENGLEFVLDHDDRKTLAQMQALVNKDIAKTLKWRNNKC
jgi:hypothetical protein